MKRARLLVGLMLKASWVRKDRALTALLSIAVVATMATVALTVYWDLESKLTREFRAFGANAIATSHDHALSEDDLAQIRRIAGQKADVLPLRYAIVKSESGAHVVAGGANLADLERLNPSWSFTPLVPSDDQETSLLLMGARVAESAGKSGSADTGYAISYGSKSAGIPYRNIAVFKSGSEEDSHIYLEPDRFTQLTGLQSDTAQLRLDGTPAEIDHQIEKLSASLPQVEFKALRQVTAAQTAVLGRTRAIVLGASIVVIVLIVVCMVATLTGSVLERRRDFAVMKALGASNSAVATLFAGEAALLSLIGGAIGFVLGSAIAWWIGRANFQAAITPRLGLILPVLLGSTLLALAASTAPLRLLRRIQPAVILRGE